jgi:hypothetical protein
MDTFVGEVADRVIDGKSKIDMSSFSPEEI